MRVLWGALVAALGVGSQAQAADLHLRCEGIGTFPETQQVDTSAMVDGHWAYGDATAVGRGAIHDWFMVDVTDAGVRVRPPRAIVPPIHGSNDDGWWPLYDTRIDDGQISGRFSLNLLNKPTVHIDRGSGAIEVEGHFKLSFHGTCQAFDPTQRRF